MIPLPPSRSSQNALEQEPRRERECAARQAALRFVDEQADSCRSAAIDLGLSPRTLANWRCLNEEGELLPRLRGRPCHEPSIEQFLVVESILQETGPRLGMPTLREYCPKTPSSLLQYLLTDYRRRFQAEHPVVVETLRWLRPGAVWAIDHSKPPYLVDGVATQIVAIRDLGSGMQLAWTPVADATAENALSILSSLVAQHGPPLVLKSDNGSAFLSQSFEQSMKDLSIVQMFSPVRMPRYNGACEAGIGGMKRRTEQLAARNNRLLDWTSDDLYGAQCWANDDHYPNGLSAGVASSRFAARSPIDDCERENFQATVAHWQQSYHQDLWSKDVPITDKLSALCHRRAVRRALVEHGYLSISQRSIPQPITSAKCA